MDELTKTLLEKCEVSSLRDFYLKWVREHDHRVSLKKISEYHKNFSPEKIEADVADIPELLVVEIPRLVPNVRRVGETRKSEGELLTKRSLVDHVGLASILRDFRSKRYLRKHATLSQLGERLGLEGSGHDETLRSLLQDAINERHIYAVLRKSAGDGTKEEGKEDLVLSFYPKFKHPAHRKDLLMVVLTLTVITLSLTLLVPFLLFINE